MVSLKRRYQLGLHRALSKRFMSTRLFLLLAQVKWGPLKPKSSKLHLLRRLLK